MTALKHLKNKECLPYEKFKKQGAGSLTDAELLAVILRTGTKNRTAVELGMSVLSQANGEK